MICDMNRILIYIDLLDFTMYTVCMRVACTLGLCVEAGGSAKVGRKQHTNAEIL